MGRTAVALLVLAVVGGCVADDQGPMPTFPVTKQGQPGATPTYATWSRPDLLPPPDEALPRTAAAPPAGARPATTTVLKPAVTAKSVVMAPPAAKPLPALPAPDPVPSAASADPGVDTDLVKATMVTLPADKPAVADSAKPQVDSPKPPADSAKPPTDAVHADPEAEAAVKDPSAPSIRMVNSKRVTLNYELKDVGASGVSNVELWCTQDAHSWKKGEIVAQTSHSFTVEVKDEGLYGFTLLARNGAGLGKEAPAAGEQPQTWVMVDVTKPTVQIASVEINHTAKGTVVDIRWSAKDKNLGPKPITLAYAEQPEGPWTPIATGVENSGQYQWQPPAAAPHRLFLKIEAVDMPGNTGVAQTVNPLRLETAVTAGAPPTDASHKPLPAPPVLDTSRPNASIMGVEPSGN